MSGRHVAITLLCFEAFALALLAWSEVILGTWVGTSPAEIAASRDAAFQIRFFLWLSAVASGALIGLGVGAALTFAPSLFVLRARGRSSVELLPAVASTAPFLAVLINYLFLREYPWL
jgi:hypothetical protein